jgi:hypothetical protein
LLAVLLLLVWASQGGAGQAPALKSVRILSRYEVSGHPGGSALTDVRWASDHSVYVLRALHGVEELELGEERTPKSLRRPVPDSRELGDLRWMAHLAISRKQIVVASEGDRLVSRPRQSVGPGLVLFQGKETAIVEDLDIAGEGLLFLGVQSKKVPYTGAVAWLGSLGTDPEDWRPVLQAPEGAKSWAVFNCSSLALGAVRFLPDRSFVVVPGFLPGAYQFASSGQLIRTWTQREIGLDTDCSGISKELKLDLHTDVDTRVSWFNRHRVLDDILPLPEGPGLLIRSLGSDGKIHWELRILDPEGRSTSYRLPIVGTRPFDRLRGDVRAGRIVLLRTNGLVQSRDPLEGSGELFVVALGPAVEKENRP